VNRVFCGLLLILVFTGSVFSQDTDLDRRVMALSSELRCLVCQNQTLADSNADLAVDLRRQIRDQLGSGKSERDVLDFMVQRYGDFVLYRPPLKATTLLLWGGPFLLLALGFLLLVRRIRSVNRQEPPLSDAERTRAAALIEPGRE
jgi:cytochrome c-type biogenesis protein CcmH